MKLQRIFTMGIILQLLAPLHASNLLTDINSASANLNSAQAALTSLLGLAATRAVPVNTTPSTPLSPTATPTIADTPANVDTAPTVVAAPVVEPVVARQIITINNNILLNLQPEITSMYSYKNSTTLPLILAITNGNMINSQQVAPGQTYIQAIDPKALVTVKAHANISAIKTSYNPAASYTLTIDSNNQLALTQISATGNALTNSCGWPMLISFIASDSTKINTVLEDGHRYQPTAGALSMVAIPLIADRASNAAPVASCSIINTSGNLTLQFAA